MTDYKTNNPYKPMARYNRRFSVLGVIGWLMFACLLAIYLIVYFAPYIDNF